MDTIQQLKQEMKLHSESFYSIIQQIANRDYYLIMYTDFIYKNIPSFYNQSKYDLHVKKPILHVTIISLSKHKHAKQLKNKIMKAISNVSCSFRIKFHLLWTRGLKDKEQIYVEQQESGIVYIRYIETNISIINKINN